MDTNSSNSNTPARNIGNFTRNAVKDFEKNIVNQHNFLEKVDQNLNDIHSEQ